MRFAMVMGTTLITVTLALGGVATAEPEWCDDGSPPPNDFRFRPTGIPSEVSSTEWIRSTTSGELDLAAGINTLEGGVAKGMRTALEKAGAKDTGDAPDRDADEERGRSDERGSLRPERSAGRGHSSR